MAKGKKIKTEPAPAPTGDNGGIGKAGNQNNPGLERVSLVPSDAKKFDQFGHKKGS